MQDVKFCAWSGVTCDGSGSVGSLQLTTPSVPSVLPPSLSFLNALTSLSVIGDTQNPSGTLPQAYANLTSLSTLHLESTNLQGELTDIFSGTKGLKTLQLVKNTGMGGTLPNGVFGSSLQNLQINNQPLDGSTLQSITSSTTLQGNLQLLDLSSTQLSTTLPSQISSFQSLTELHLDNTNLQSPLPSSAFPGTLKVLSLSGNPALGSGGVGGVCALAAQGGLGGGCTLGGSGLSAPSGGCGGCTF